MRGYRKLGKPTAQRRAMLRGLVTTLLVSGKVETTDTRAKEVRKIAEKLITLAVREHDHFTVETKTATRAKRDDKGRKMLRTATSRHGAKYDVVEREQVQIDVQVDQPSRLAARRQMLRVLYETHTEKGQRVNTVNHVFSDVAPKYRGREGGYTRMIKMGPRRGDGAEIVRLELV